jgi:hypothetical protein
VFDNNPNSRILQPNGIDIGKKDYYIVGLASENFANDELSRSSLTFVKEDYTPDEFRQISEYIMRKGNFSEGEIKIISKAFETLKQNSLNIEKMNSCQ